MKLNKSLLLLIFTLSFSGLITSQNSNKKEVSNILDQYFKAIGGKEKALQVKTFHSESKGTLEKKEITLTRKLMLPHSFYSSMSLDGYMVSKNVFNGTKGYVIQQDIEEELDSKELKRHKQNRSIFPEFDYYKNAKYLGLEKVNNEEAYVLEIENTKIFYSKSTGLKIKGITRKNKDGHEFEQHIFFSKYLNFKGINFPTRLTIIAGNKKIILQTLSILINRDVTETDFN